MATLPTTTPRTPTPRWLSVVMRCDKELSFWFVAAGFFFAPLLLVLDPWPMARTIAVVAISLAGLWLGLLGVFMAAGLARVLRAGHELPDEYWARLLGYPDRPRTR
ncbi:hypothetical protein [Gordonia aurantiaca]|uniref:hypothetical protein n=1 Tax=Gordonia sp. B21 TaxID=3151852 RepID=UPI00326420DD